MSNSSLIAKVTEEAVLSYFRSSIKHLILHVTGKCNMSCRHCFISAGTFKEDLSLDEIKAIAKALPDLIWLDIGGGEPLLRDDLEDIIALFNFRELSIPTNGWDTGSIFKKVKGINSRASGRLIVTLSLDGMQKTHDEIRCPGSFERTVQTFNKLREVRGLRIKFNTVLCEKNCDEIPDLMCFVKKLEPDFHSILKLRGSPRDPSMKLPPLEKIEALEREANHIQKSYGYGRTGLLSKVQRNYQKYKGDLNIRILREKKQVIPCLAGASHLVIWPEGSVSPCELLPPVGNIRKKNLKELLNGVEMKKAISSIRKGSCFCTHDCNMIENILFNLRSYSRLLW